MKRTKHFFKFNVDEKSYLKKSLNKKQFMTVVILSVILGVLCVLTSYLLWENPQKSYLRYLNQYKVNMLVDSTVISEDNFYLIDEEATSEKIENLRNNSLPVFSLNLEDSLKIMDNIENLTNRIKENKEAYDSFISPRTGFSTTTYQYYIDNSKIIDTTVKELAQKLINQGIFDKEELESKVKNSNKLLLISTLSETEKKEFYSSECLTTDNYLLAIENSFINYKNEQIIIRSSDLITTILKQSIIGNVYFDSLETKKLQNENIKDSKPIVYEIKKGDKLLEKNTLVTDKQLKVLSLISKQYSGYPVLKFIGIALYVLLVILIFLRVFNLNLEKGYHNYSYYMIFLVGCIVTIIITYFLHQWANPYDEVFLGPTLPILVMPMLISMASNNKNLGYICSLFLSLLVLIIPNANILTFSYCVLSAFSCIFFEKFLNRRRDLFYEWLYAYGCNLIFAVICLMFLNIEVLSNISLLGLKILINVFGTYVIISFLLPILEEFLNLPTALRLNELSYISNSLIDKLEKDAPGTYNHSKQVSELAFAAAKSIGANELLCKAGGLYHDIGKIDHAGYFTENQNHKKNNEKSLSKYSSTLAVTIIRSHVKLGVEKGREYGLPPEILDIIGNHHGNDIVSFFYQEDVKAYTAGKQQDKPKKEDYAYLGVPPKTKEEGIVMLCDCAEAATRSLGRPNLARYEKYVNDNVLLKKIENNQLEDCPLTCKELSTVTKVIVENLLASSHGRIAYPKETDENIEEVGEK
ncbi:MAG: HDIG domain-containing metalloprotein [Sphaerochaetaceae bacterium]